MSLEKFIKKLRSDLTNASCENIGMHTQAAQYQRNLGRVAVLEEVLDELKQRHEERSPAIRMIREAMVTLDDEAQDALATKMGLDGKRDAENLARTQELERELLAANKRIQELIEKNDFQRQMNDQHQDHIKSLQIKLDRQNFEMAELQVKHSLNEAIHNDVLVVEAELRQRVEDLESTVEKKTQEYRSLYHDYVDTKNKCYDLEEQLARKEVMIKTLSSDIGTLVDEDVDRLHSILGELEMLKLRINNILSF